MIYLLNIHIQVQILLSTKYGYTAVALSTATLFL